MQLIDNWKQAWKFNSVRIAVFTALINLLVSFLPALGVPEGWMTIINTLLGIAITVARVTKQPELNQLSE